MTPDFLIAYTHVMQSEIGPHAKTRGYVNDPDDHGGETIAGISRKFHHDWVGWELVDHQKLVPDFPNNLSTVPELDGLIEVFYRVEFWNSMRCDDVLEHAVAQELFDTGVNMSQKRAVTYLQQALNLLNLNGKLFGDVTEDGAIGQGTLNALNIYAAGTRGNFGRLLTVMNVLQGSFYIDRMRAEKSQEKYVGWFDRVTLTKT